MFSQELANYLLCVCSLDLAEVCGYFKRTTSSLNEDEDQKLDERMHPIPSELHGAVTRTPLEVIESYEEVGELKCQEDVANGMKNEKMFIFKHTGVLHNVLVTWFE